jgi:proteasome accessory factor C
MSAADRLGRLLALVPYLMARPGIRVADAAADLGVTEEQLREDLQLLWVCGLPGYGPGDLIDMVLDDETVTLTFDAGIERPLRLTADEALALVVALRALAEVPGVGGGGAVERALAKLESAAGDAAHGASQVAVQMHEGEDRIAEVNAAVDQRRAIRMTYYTAARDQTTERVVDPIRVLLVDGRSYLEAWCRSAQALRRFRLDRIDSLTVLDEPSSPPPGTVGGDVRSGVFQPSASDPVVTLRLGRSARWVTEYYPVESATEESDGCTHVVLRASDLGWAKRLVLGLGEDAEILSPSELITIVRADAEAALKYYPRSTA